MMKLKQLLAIVLSLALCFSAFAGIAVSAAADATILGDTYDYERKAEDYYSSAASWATYSPETEGVEGWVYPTNGAAERIYNIAAPVTAFSIRVIALDKTAASAVTVFLSKDNSVWVDSKAAVEGYSDYDGDYEVYNLVSYPDANAEYKFIKVCVPTDGNKTGILGLAYNTVYTGEKATSYDKVISATAETPAEIELGTVGNSQWKVADWWGNYWYNYDANMLDENNNTENYGYLILKSAAHISDFSLKLSVRQELTRLSRIKVYGSSDKETWTPIYYNFTELVSYGNDSVGYRYITELYSDISDCNYTYIKLDLTDCDAAWQGHYPGVYSVSYNYKSITDASVTEMVDYEVEKYPAKATGVVTTLPEGVELLSLDDTYSWYVDNQDGYFWYNSKKDGATTSSKGYAIFAADTYFDNFAIKLHSVETKYDVNEVKVYASNDKTNWLAVDCNAIPYVKAANRCYGYLFADLIGEYKYIKVDLSGAGAYWNSVYPGIYSFAYNNVEIVDSSATEMVEYAVTKYPSETTGAVTAVADGVELLSLDETYSWYIDNQDGYFWYNSKKDGATTSSKGYAIFTADTYFDDFAVKLHSVETKYDVNEVKVYVSKDKTNWITVDCNSVAYVKGTNRCYGYLFADLIGEYKYIKVDLSGAGAYWNSVYPGIYNFAYNEISTEPEVPTMEENYEITKYPVEATGAVTTIADGVELLSYDDTYSWHIDNQDGYFWYNSKQDGAVTSSKGYAIFTAETYFDKFAVKLESNEAKYDVNEVKVYASKNKIDWMPVDCNSIPYVKGTKRYYGYLFADLTGEYKYIKVDLSKASAYWNSVYPGIYNFAYNNVDIVEADPVIKDIYDITRAPSTAGAVTSVPDGVELLSYSDEYSWYAEDQDGMYWYNSDNSKTDSVSKGYAIFTADGYFDDFNLKIHSLSASSDVSKIKIYASTDKEIWHNIDYKYTDLTLGTYGKRYYSYLYADILSGFDFKYIKVDFSSASASWNSLYPGIYSFAYNYDTVYELGDVNLDGEVNILDLVRLKKNLINHDFKYTSAADIDANGFVNAVDLSCLRKILMEVPLVFDDTSTEPEFHGDVIENAYSTTAYTVLDDDLSDYSKMYQKNMNGSIATSYASDIGDSYRLGVTSAEAAESDNNVVWYLEDGFTEYCVETLRNDADAVEDNFTVFVSKDGQTWEEQSVTPEIKAAGAASWKHLYYKATGLGDGYKFLKVQFPVAKHYYALAIGRVRLNGISYMDEPTANYENRASATFYVDSVYGSDDNHGMSKNAPFKTLAKVSSNYYQAGDKILFKCGTSYNGTLRIKGNGDIDNEIYVGTYGSGAAPAIYSNGNFAVTLEAYNITLDGLDITNPNGIVGVHIVPLVSGENPNVTVKNCNIHDIHSNISDTTALVRGEGGIVVSTATAEPSYFNGLTLENNTIKNVNTSGIFVNNHWDNDESLPQLWGTAAGKPHLNVTIKGNYLDTVGVDGIMVAMSKNVLIENNTLYRAYQCTADNFNNGAGIWVINCDDNVIQYNEVGYMDRKNGQIDGEAFDIDIGCNNTTLQYNYSHDNVGGFLLMCTSYDFDYSTNAYTQDVTVRYNVSIGDGLLDSDEQGIIVISDNVANVDIYNNTIYMSGEARTLMPIKSVHAFFDGSIIDAWLGRNIYSTNINVSNNIFHAEDGVNTVWDMSKSKSVTYNNNIYSGNATAANNVTTQDGRVSDNAARIQDVTFTGNLTDVLDGRDVALNLKPITTISGATVIAENGGFDFSGEAIVDAFYGAIKN